MSELKDRSRPVIEVDCGAFGTVKARRLSAAALVGMSIDFAEIHGETVDGNTNEILAKLGRWYCEVLAEAVEEPKATADEWWEDSWWGDLITIGEAVTSAIGLVVTAQKKTGSSGQDIDFCLTSPESSGSQISSDSLSESAPQSNCSSGGSPTSSSRGESSAETSAHSEQ